MIPPRKRTIIARIITAINMGCFLPGMSMDLKMGLHRSRAWEVSRWFMGGGHNLYMDSIFSACISTDGSSEAFP